MSRLLRIARTWENTENFAAGKRLGGKELTVENTISNNTKIIIQQHNYIMNITLL